MITGVEDGTLYVNVHGDVLTCCDLSYESQKEVKIGNVNEASLEGILLNHTKEVVA